MNWKKIGIIYQPAKKEWWDQLYAMMPTPIHLEPEGIIRIYFGVTDHERFGRTSFIDVSDNNPLQIVNNSRTISLDLGEPGTFDDSGAVPSSILIKDNKTFLYYVGFQRAQKVPYMLFSGLAISTDHRSFSRYSQAPIMDRRKENVFSNAAPFVMYDKEESIYKMWFWLGRKWMTVNNKMYINAEIHYATSMDALNWNISPLPCIVPNPETEFSVGRPWVVKDNGFYKMYYSVRYVNKLYRLGYAWSEDGMNWIRKDDEMGIDVSANGWDSEMICYGSVINIREKTYLFYNGNNNGETGFGLAELMN